MNYSCLCRRFVATAIIHNSQFIIFRKMHLSGIQQMGIGIPDVQAAFGWYRQHFGIDVPIFEEAATAALMLPYTGGQPRDRHAILALNGHGGGGMEIWQYTSRVPVGPPFKIRVGDLGLFACKIKCRDAEKAFHFLRKKGVTMLGGLEPGPDERLHFFVQDPWRNVFEITTTDEFFTGPDSGDGPGSLFGGVFGAVIGVSKISESQPFYSDILGYDVVLSDKTEKFRDIAGLDGGFDECRRVLLKHSRPREGAFSPLLGSSEIELVQVVGRKPRHIFEGRLWGDLGFIQIGRAHV